MIKSFGDYNIERSSSSDINNIKWTKKNSIDTEKLKTKKKITKNTSSTNIIYSSDAENVKSSTEKVFKVRIIDTESKSKQKKNDK